MTIDIDTAGIAAAMLLSFTTLGAASWAMLKRARAAGYQRAARRQEAAVRWLHFSLAAICCAHAHPPSTEARPSEVHSSATPTGRSRGARRSHQIQLKHIARSSRRNRARR